MQIHGPSQVHGPHRHQRAPLPPRTAGTQVDVGRPARSIASIFRRRPKPPSKRPKAAAFATDLVNLIRSQIAAGTYDTPEKMDIAMERLLDQMG